MRRLFAFLLCLAALSAGAGLRVYSQDRPAAGIVPKVEPKPTPDPKAVLPANATGKAGRILELRAQTAGEVDWEVPGEFDVRFVAAEKLAILVPQQPGTYVVRLAVCENGKPKIHRCIVFVEGLVPPGPSPSPEPGPGPKPVPTPDGGLRVLFVVESSANLNREQLHALNSVKVAAYLNAKCARGSDGTPGWRRWDPQQTVEHADPVMRQLWNDAKAEALKSLPALVVASGKQAIVYPLPATEGELMTVLKRYGGE